MRNNAFSTTSRTTLLIPLLPGLALPGFSDAASTDESCAPTDGMEFICGPMNAEDWSGYRAPHDQVYPDARLDGCHAREKQAHSRHGGPPAQERLTA